MKHRRVHLAVILTALVVAGGFLASAGRTGSAQSRRRKNESPVKPTVLVKTPTKSASASPFAVAAEENAILKNELIWTFGGKQQRGWYLYDLLIRRTLDTPSSPDTAEFAVALSAWQKKTGLSPIGVFDENSLMAMVSQWQNKRLQNRAFADVDQLLTAPSSDFYDPERLVELRQVERNTYAAYKQMVKAAIADPSLKLAHSRSDELAPAEKYFKIISAFRSREYQEELRRKAPKAGSAGLAVNNSPHFTGRALDIYVGGDPVDTKDENRAIQVNTPAYRWLVHNAERFGFRPYFYEPWHWEYVR
jgi:zinc D-Ala-D-Ala carboxypeptidase